MNTVNIPGFNAEASLYATTGRYMTMSNFANANEGGIGPASFGSFVSFRLPAPPPSLPDPCSACISDCVHRGDNFFSCQNLCSFLCE